MRTMANLVSDIANLNSKDLEMLAQGLAWFTHGTSNQASKLEHYLNVHIREQEEKYERFKNNALSKETV